MTKATIRAYREVSAKNSAHAALIKDCLDTIERLQKFTRRGTTPEPDPEPFPKKAKPKAGTADPRITEFTEGWVAAYKTWHREPYPHGGVRDAMAVKRLLLLAQIDDLLDTAYEAWQHPEKFNCSHAITIAGFCARYANVRQELKNLNGSKPRQQAPGVTL